MRNALGVHVFDGYAWRTVTSSASAVRFSKQAPGGFVDASCRLALPRRTFTGFGPADLMRLDDARSGRRVWDGFTKNPTPRFGSAGESWDVTAVGGSVVASDQAQGLSYIDSSYESWHRSQAGGNAVASGSADTSDDPVTDSTSLGQVLKCQLNPGTPVDNGNWAGASYNVLARIGQEVGSVRVTTRSGLASVDYQAEIYCSPSGTLLPLAADGRVTPTPVVNTRNVVDTIPSGTKAMLLRIRRTGISTNVTLDNVWSVFGALHVTARRVDRFGALASGAAGVVDPTYVLAHWVVEDLLGRVLAMCDPVTAVVEPGTYRIDQLTYFDGAKPSTILNDLVGLYEPDMLWEVGERLPNGLYRFAFRAWPTTPRYLLGSGVDIEQVGSDVDLANRVLVTWTDATGITVTRAFGQEVRELGAGSPVLDDGTPDPSYGGRTVDADPITLPEGKGSLANAAQIAGQVLDSVSGTVPQAAKATVGYRVFDRLRNLHVEPHEIEPGHIARVIETGQDLRVTAIEYDDDSGVAELDLGTPVLTMDQRVQQLALAAKS